MVPSQPPLPTARYLPFQPLSGSQTSMPISESWVGLSFAVTRQNPGSPEILSVVSGMVKPPSGTTSLRVMETPGEADCERLAHDWADNASGFVAAAKSAAQRTNL